MFCLRRLKVGPQSLLACRVSAEKSAVNLIGFPLKVTWWLCLTVLKILSFVLTFFFDMESHSVAHNGVQRHNLGSVQSLPPDFNDSPTSAS